MKTPVMMVPEALDFSRVIRAGETIGWADATAEPVFLTRMLDAQAERCPPFRVFFALTFSDALAAGHANVTSVNQHRSGTTELRRHKALLSHMDSPFEWCPDRRRSGPLNGHCNKISKL